MVVVVVSILTYILRLNAVMTFSKDKLMVKMISKKIDVLLPLELTKPEAYPEDEKSFGSKKNLIVHSFAELVENLAEKEKRDDNG